jgi:hypothetical protein
MIYFALIEQQILLVVHCKGGGTTLKHYMYETFLKSKKLDKDLKHTTIHSLLRKNASPHFNMGSILSNSDVEKMTDTYKNYKIIYIHRNYKDRLASCFYNKFVDADDCGHFLMHMRNKFNSTYDTFTFKAFVKGIVMDHIRDIHWNPYPTLFNAVPKIMIPLSSLYVLSDILNERGLPALTNKQYNTSNTNLEKLSEYNEEISILNILRLRKDNKYIPYNLFYNDEINDMLQPMYGHEILV